jgi:hypothetical protein
VRLASLGTIVQSSPQHASRLVAEHFSELKIKVRLKGLPFKILGPDHTKHLLSELTRLKARSCHYDRYRARQPSLC